jgi:hypothetical protein
MAFGPVVNFQGPLPGGVTIAGTPRVLPPNFILVTSAFRAQLPSYNPSNNGVVPSFFTGPNVGPIKPLPGTGGGGGGGVVGMPIDSG